MSRFVLLTNGINEARRNIPKGGSNHFMHSVTLHLGEGGDSRADNRSF